MAEWTPLGDRAIRFARPAASARAIVRAVRAWPGVIDVVVARDDVAAYFTGEPRVEPGWLAALATAREDELPVREHVLRARYAGPDLDAVARTTGLSTTEVAAVHRDASYVVETMGFAPGFAYLAGLDVRLVLPRRATPRPRVPAGAIGIADAYTAVYPFDSPGGWHLIGEVVDTRLFDASGPLLGLGDRVRFES
jgi:5-oxoprolinase (ATP-hydrolysing) subunit A